MNYLNSGQRSFDPDGKFAPKIGKYN
jgi:N-methylhydantoinase A